MLTTFGFLAPTTAVIVLVIALVIFGPGKLPEVGKALGKGIKEFKSATNDEEGKGAKTDVAKKSDLEDKQNA